MTSAVVIGRNGGSTHHFQSLTRVSRFAANTTGRREVATDRIRVRCGPALCGIWKNVRSFRPLNPARNLFLGLGRALQPHEQTRSGLTNRLHSETSPAGELHEHLATGASACPNQGGAYPHPNGANR